ncbi:uncharacterized protein GGS25DRAFT_510865 [Hypoxylon fragiforme]|uniref:uncharacterized protein n=1 Tax=Hypoxylon fragiforme TaxID=63214 RepID=UPI0020C61AA9|nr:uncharacterized protein GGS25DRAFT_510865 [Hypoxylon fragiforme]KAI2603302.1 hypothetical protein GGS25DRAFT_510865 [Hypoxylon fragiforme]
MFRWKPRGPVGFHSITMVPDWASSLNLLPIFRGYDKPLRLIRTIHHQAYDAFLDQEDLTEARKWHASFTESSLPKGQTTYSRSSGPGGQHVNKTESKATTVWSMEELSKSLPKLLQSALRNSRYYSKRNDSITIQAQTQRSRTANTDDNRLKLVDELLGIYKQQVPNPTSHESIKKHEAIEKSFQENRLKSKKKQSTKKAFRKGVGRDE